jgi:hypothetical protein
LMKRSIGAWAKNTLPTSSSETRSCHQRNASRLSLRWTRCWPVSKTLPGFWSNSIRTLF